MRRRRRPVTRHEAPTPQESRALAAVMRRLPGRYAGRIGPRLQQKVTEAAASGEWEWAVQQLVAALRSRSAQISAEERDELRFLLTALHLPADGVDALAARPQERSGGSPARPMPAT